jgi:ferric-dicitrate binding protein FerR (iron transport regulator)
MKLEVSRDVVRDLWPLCRSGEASADSRALIDAFLSEDGALASTLRESEALTQAMPAFRLSPDAERRLLDEARRRARTKLLVIGGAVAMVGLIALVALGGILFFVARTLR